MTLGYVKKLEYTFAGFEPDHNICEMLVFFFLFSVFCSSLFMTFVLCEALSGKKKSSCLKNNLWIHLSVANTCF